MKDDLTDPSKMTVKELESHLLTLDYKGREFKRLVLDELKLRWVASIKADEELRRSFR